MSVRLTVIILLLAMSTGALAQSLSSAFEQGTTLGRSGNQTARGTVSSNTATSNVPGYTANPPEAAYFGGGGISAPAAAATRACVNAGGDSDSCAAQRCNAVDFSQSNPSRHPSFTIGPNDPLRTGAKTITADPQQIAGNIAGTYSDCTVQPSTPYCAKSQRTRNTCNFSSLWAPAMATLGLLQSLRLSLGPAR